MLQSRCTRLLLKVCLVKTCHGDHTRDTFLVKAVIVLSKNQVKRITPSIPGLQPLSLGPTPQNLTGLYRNTQGALSLIMR
jgi:hypothetical protein